jgi:curved DNA-binding protein CbpA
MQGLLLIFLALSFLGVSLPFRRFLISSNRHGRSIRSGAIAKPTDESISPTFYQEDLYAVLGVSINATKKDLRDAYWSIASANHPDRNDTPEALSVFRNASYAYKILGRDAKTRAEYDNIYRTKQYINALDQLGSNVIKPLAMDVAVPLINLTVRSIGSVAVPFFRDAFEQSSAVFKAAFGEGEVNLDEDSDILTRAANAAYKTSMEQKIRRTNESMSSSKSRLETVTADLDAAVKVQGQLRSSLAELEAEEARDRKSVEDMIRWVRCTGLQYPGYH